MPAESVDEALEQIEEILETIDEIEGDYPRSFDKGEDFLEDVREKAQSMAETLENMDWVTDAQARALDNWQAGVNRWHPGKR